LTWEGQDYLDAVRSNTVWGKTKEAINKSAESATFDVVKAIAAGRGQKMILAAAGIG
jgi:hypothetical protein